MLGKLNEEEEKVLTEFKEQLLERYAERIVSVLVFGSKARGGYTEESDVDVLVVTQDGDWRFADSIREIGYALDAGIGYKLSIQVMPKSKLDYLRRRGFGFAESLSREGVSEASGQQRRD